MVSFRARCLRLICMGCKQSLFVTKYNGMRYVQGVQEFGSLIAAGLEIAVKVPAVISEVAGLFRWIGLRMLTVRLKVIRPGKCWLFLLHIEIDRFGEDPSGGCFANENFANVGAGSSMNSVPYMPDGEVVH